MIKVALALLGVLLGAAIGVRASRAVWAVVTQPGLGEDPE